MLTIARVNKELKAKGWKAELVRGDGYFWVDGDDVCWAYSSSISVYRLNHLTLEQWVEEVRRIMEDSAARKPV